MSDKDLGADAAAVGNDTGSSKKLPASGPRYCQMCDEFMKPRECKACGMPTEKVPQ